MTRYAIIDNGIVINIAEADADFALSQGWVDAAGAAIGDLWDGVDFSLPAPAPLAVPQAVTMRQARLALLGAGLLAQVTNAVAAMPGTQGDAARIEWEFSGDVHRDWPLVTELFPALGLTGAQLDALFIGAAAL